MSFRPSSLIVRASLAIGAFMILAPLVSLIAYRLLTDWRTYAVLALLSVVAYFIVRDRTPRDRQRSGSIERTPYELTGAWNRRRQ